MAASVIESAAAHGNEWAARAGCVITADGSYAARLARSGDSWFPERWTLDGPEPYAVPLPGNQPEEPGTEVLPMADGRVLIHRLTDGRHSFSLLYPTGTGTGEVQLGAIECPDRGTELRLLPPAPGGSRAYALAVGPGSAAVWLVAGGAFGPEHLAEVPGRCSGGLWLGGGDRLLALDREFGGRTKTVVVDLERGGEVSPLLQISEESNDRLVLADADSGLILIRSDAPSPGRERLGWGVLGSTLPVRFPECLHLADCAVTPFATQPGQVLTPESCAVALRLDGAAGTWFGVWRPAGRYVHHLAAPEGWLAGSGWWTRDGVLHLPYATGAVPCGVTRVEAPTGDAGPWGPWGPDRTGAVPGEAPGGPSVTGPPERTAARPVPLQHAPLVGRTVANAFAGRRLAQGPGPLRTAAAAAGADAGSPWSGTDPVGAGVGGSAAPGAGPEAEAGAVGPWSTRSWSAGPEAARSGAVPPESTAPPDVEATGPGGGGGTGPAETGPDDSEGTGWVRVAQAGPARSAATAPAGGDGGGWTRVDTTARPATADGTWTPAAGTGRPPATDNGTGTGTHSDPAYAPPPAPADERGSGRTGGGGEGHGGDGGGWTRVDTTARPATADGTWTPAAGTGRPLTTDNGTDTDPVTGGPAGVGHGTGRDGGPAGLGAGVVLPPPAGAIPGPAAVTIGVAGGTDPAATEIPGWTRVDTTVRPGAEYPRRTAPPEAAPAAAFTSDGGGDGGPDAATVGADTGTDRGPGTDGGEGAGADAGGGASTGAGTDGFVLPGSGFPGGPDPLPGHLDPAGPLPLPREQVDAVWSPVFGPGGSLGSGPAGDPGREATHTPLANAEPVLLPRLAPLVPEAPGDGHETVGTPPSPAPLKVTTE